MKINDSVLGVLLIMFSCFVLVSSRSLPSLPGYAYGAGFFPSIAAVFVLVCGCILLFRGIKNGGALLVLGEWTRSPKLVSNICLVPLNLVFYMIFADILGFVITASVMIALTIWWLRGKAISAVLVAVFSSVATYVFFAKIMLVPLPAGIAGF